jgi:hypothetical protein
VHDEDARLGDVERGCEQGPAVGRVERRERLVRPLGCVALEDVGKAGVGAVGIAMTRRAPVAMELRESLRRWRP